MIRTKNGLLKGLVITLTSVLPATLLAGCSSAEQSDPVSEQVSESAAELGVPLASCSTALTSGYNTTTSALVLAMTTPNVVIGVVGGYITVNGSACVKTTGVALTPAMVKQITITGTSAAEKVVVDMLSGSFGPSILSSAGGIIVDLSTGTDAFSLRGTSGADKFTAGKAASDSYFEVSGDAVADIRVQGAESLAVSLSSGADIFSARGGTFGASHLSAGVTTLAALSADIVVNAGDGDDTLTGGDGNDTLSGGEGNDLFKTAAATDGADIFVGGNGNDKIDYSLRTADLTITMAGVIGSGLTGGAENDTISADIEDLIGGTGNDTISGNTLSNHLQGGAGNDTLWGGLANASCLLDVDTLDGEAGDDTFKMTALSDCADTLTGGAGTDKADYQLRTVALTIILDGGALDGEALEKDNVKADIEVVVGGTGNDSITGSAANDDLHGGAGVDTLNGGAGDDILAGDSGNDILNGEAGNDTFDEGAAETLILAGSELKGAGGDVINGGSGSDTVTYTQRTANLAVTLCMDPGKIVGATLLTAANCIDSDGEALEGDKIVNVTHVIGGTGNDSIDGSTGDDTLEGGAGNDALDGGAGSDTLFGDAGVDDLHGDAGDDYLDGGAGDDKLNGDTTTGAAANIADGDICIGDATDTPANTINCDL